MLKALLRRDFTLIMGKKTEVAQLLIFFTIVNFIFSFTLADISQDRSVEIAVAVILIAQILAMNLAKRWIFQRDYEIKLLQQIYLSQTTSFQLITAKILSNFIIFGLPIALFTPITTVFFNLDTEILPNVILCTAINAFLIATINVMLSAITVGLKNGGIISVILSIPLLIPVIVLISSFLTSESPDYEKLASGCLGLGILFFILAILAGNIGIATAAED